jgi:tol-pal system protein YbgF
MLNRSIALSLLLSLGAAVNAAPAPVIDVNSGNLEKRFEELERKVDARTDAQHRVQQQLDEMQQQVDELRGAVELHNHQLEKILERQRELYLEIDKRIEAVMQHSSAVVPVNETPQQGSNVVVAAGEDEAYDRAVNLILRDKLYDQAIPEFQAFLKNYPKSSYVANAHYWLGQLLFNKQDWTGAGEQFQAVVRNFPDSTKRADALWKLGVVEQKKANLAKAKQLFEQVIKEYPNSSASKLAQTSLNGLK